MLGGTITNIYVSLSLCGDCGVCCYRFSSSVCPRVGGPADKRPTLYIAHCVRVRVSLSHLLDERNHVITVKGTPRRDGGTRSASEFRCPAGRPDISSSHVRYVLVQQLSGLVWRHWAAAGRSMAATNHLKVAVNVAHSSSSSSRGLDVISDRLMQQWWWWWWWQGGDGCSSSLHCCCIIPPVHSLNPTAPRGSSSPTSSSSRRLRQVELFKLVKTSCSSVKPLVDQVPPSTGNMKDFVSIRRYISSHVISLPHSHIHPQTCEKLIFGICMALILPNILALPCVVEICLSVDCHDSRFCLRTFTFTLPFFVPGWHWIKASP